MADIFRKGSGKTVESYHWTMEDKPGEFQWIPKEQIGIDYTYQRSDVTQDRVNSIARSWCWAACGCLIVAQRPDKSYWAMDGQHRELGALKRNDISALPCLVFQVSTLADEARLFNIINCVRGPVRVFDRFKNMLTYEDETAVSVKEMVEASGYTIAKTQGKFQVRCIEVLLRWYRRDKDIARSVWVLCVDIFAGESVLSPVYSGLCCLEVYLTKHSLGSILDKHNRDVLVGTSVKALQHSINETVAYQGKSGGNVFAEAIIRILNHKRRVRRIPSIMADDSSADGEEA